MKMRKLTKISLWIIGICLLFFIFLFTVIDSPQSTQTDNSTKIDKIGYLSSVIDGECDPTNNLENLVPLWNGPGGLTGGNRVRYNVQNTCVAPVRILIEKQNGDWYEVIVSDRRPEYDTKEVMFGWAHEDFVRIPQQ